MILEIHWILFDDVFATLKAHYGEVRDAWWITGDPKQVRIDCDVRYKQRGRHVTRPVAVAQIIDYSQIVVHKSDWKIFKVRSNFYCKGLKAKPDRLFGRISRLRNITTPVEEGPLPRDGVSYVRDVHVLVKLHIGRAEAVDGITQLLFDGCEQQHVAAQLRST